MGALPLPTGGLASSGAFGDMSSQLGNLLEEATKIASDHAKKTPAAAISKGGHGLPSGQDAKPPSLQCSSTLLNSSGC